MDGDALEDEQEPENVQDVFTDIGQWLVEAMAAEDFSVHIQFQRAELRGQLLALMDRLGAASSADAGAPQVALDAERALRRLEASELAVACKRPAAAPATRTKKQPAQKKNEIEIPKGLSLKRKGDCWYWFARGTKDGKQTSGVFSLNKYVQKGFSKNDALQKAKEDALQWRNQMLRRNTLAKRSTLAKSAKALAKNARGKRQALAKSAGGKKQEPKKRARTR
eukprot:TRINITY_DN14505_c0_g2_i2.p1 TRINITY_DN14505_c0_g2~~TRINITY_DN14505_c0_g2_i2.p1  ORF type:complete len:240 (+),score=69.46 TRINITY_DN14505_c0_g2_i2:53-721(+)